MRVSLFIPCVVDQFFPQVGISSVKLLKHCGASVEYPHEQTCCAPPAFNSGYRSEAKTLAQRFLRIFSRAEYVVAPSGSCVTMVREFYGHLDLPTTLSDEFENLKSRIFELSEFMVKVMKCKITGASFPHRITYHNSCHLLRELWISEYPRLLIHGVKGVEMVDLPESTRCCGFGGTFSVKFPEISVAMGYDKIQNILRTGAEYVIANDSSCLMHIDGLLRRQKSPVRTMHIAELLTQGI